MRKSPRTAAGETWTRPHAPEVATSCRRVRRRAARRGGILPIESLIPSVRRPRRRGDDGLACYDDVQSIAVWTTERACSRCGIDEERGVALVFAARGIRGTGFALPDRNHGSPRRRFGVAAHDDEQTRAKPRAHSRIDLPAEKERFLRALSPDMRTSATYRTLDDAALRPAQADGCSSLRAIVDSADDGRSHDVRERASVNSGRIPRRTRTGSTA